MTISQALKKYKDIEADLLLGHVLKQPKEFLYMHGDTKLSLKAQKTFETLATKRRAGVPAAYIVGYKYFYGLKFKVNRNVLIPRPETEWLVAKGLQIINKKLKAGSFQKIKVLDVGTGSGCIAISIAKNIDLKKVQVFALDISASALRVAETNANDNGVKISFSKNDLLTGKKGKFDLIIANLPYVPYSDYKKFLSNLKFEPKIALTDGTEEFTVIQNFLQQYGRHLKPTGTLLLEFDPKTVHLLKDHKAKIYNDLHGLKRYARADNI